MKVPVAKQRKRLKKKAEALIHLYVRKKACDFSGNVECFTCRRTVPFEKTNAGHRYHGKLDLSEDNLKAQCITCNLWKHGELGSFERRLIEDFGLEWAKNLEQRAARDTGIKDVQELQRIIDFYTEKLKTL